MSKYRCLMVLCFVFVASLSLLLNPCQADVRLASLFSDHMVLQRNMETPVWGWADANERITVSIGDCSKSTDADMQGKWSVKLDKLPAGGPLDLVVIGANRVVVKDVLVGEVWLCSGQSNMAMTVTGALDYPKESAAANFPEIRMFKVGAHATPEIQEQCEGTWSVCHPETVGRFSATAYFFGRTLHKELGVPIGLINSSWGGTDVAAWTSLSAQKRVPAIGPKLDAYNQLVQDFDAEATNARNEKRLALWQEKVEKAKAQNLPRPRKPRKVGSPDTNQNRPANLFNGMIHPLIPFAIQGAIWYQGERNSKSVEDGILYSTQLATLIQDWRARWKQGDFQFITVQLPNFRTPQVAPVETTGWVMVREAELRTLQMDNTGLAVTTDIGDAKNIHPKNKQEVGRRLALWALGTTYGREIVYSGPRMVSCKRTPDGELRVTFAHTGNGLQVQGGGPLRGFAIAQKDGKFFDADAVIDGKTVGLSCKNVVDPAEVRYGWAENPYCNLVNSAGLPATPFRTDNRDVTKEGGH